jgi:hypothetical protein
MDWTESPYVAAYFAFRDELRDFVRFAGSRQGKHGHVRVWGLRFWDDIAVPGEFELLRDLPATLSQRAQRGLFTKLLSEKHADFQSYLESRGTAHCLEAYDIPKEDASEALYDLYLMNLTPSTLFPDLNGAAEQANLSMDELRADSSFMQRVVKPMIAKHRA